MLCGWGLLVDADELRAFLQREGSGLDIDHIVPLAEGGTSDMTNLRTLCTTCHAKRGKG